MLLLKVLPQVQATLRYRSYLTKFIKNQNFILNQLKAYNIKKRKQALAFVRAPKNFNAGMYRVYNQNNKFYLTLTVQSSTKNLNIQTLTFFKKFLFVTLKKTLFYNPLIKLEAVQYRIPHSFKFVIV